MLSEFMEGCQESEVCVWTYDDINCKYDTTCERAFQFIEDDFEENRFEYCPHCGKKIDAV